MNHRSALRLLACAGVASTPRLSWTTLNAQSPRWPALTLHGSGPGLPLVIINNGNTQVRIGPTVSEHRSELEQLGWQVRMIDGYNHGLGARLEVIVPLVRDFLAAQAR